MARPMWTGVLTFGLVSVPVALYTATRSHDVRFHQLQRGTSDRVRNKRVNERTGKEVEFSDIVKGYEVAEGEYVIVEPEELEQVSPGRSRTIDIAGFVDLAEVDPIFFDRTYYLGPRGEEYQKVYSLLVESLGEAGKAGLAMFAMRGKEYLTAVRSENGILELHTMHFADEVRDPGLEVDNLPGEVRLSPQELRTARQLIDALAVEWKPEEWHDTYEDQVRELVESKIAGREVAVSPGPEPEATNVIDLMDALRRSLEGAGGKTGTGGTRKAPGRKVPAATRTPKRSGGRKSTSTKAATAGKTATAGKARGGKRTGGAAGGQPLDELTKAELYKRASDLDIPHRSTMTRDQLQDALRHADRPHRAAS
ncbi:non-homologous end joining protein Ku [Kitasatospora sp. NPDC004240]